MFLGAMGLCSLPSHSSACDKTAPLFINGETQVPSSLDPILINLRQSEDPALVNALRRAFEASPALKSQYETLVNSKAIVGIELVGFRTINSWRLRVRIEDNKLYISRSFLREIAQRPSDKSNNALQIAQADLIFFLGFMGQKLANHEAILEQDNADFRNFKPVKSEKGDVDISTLLGGISRRHKTDSAIGYLKGWNLAVCWLLATNEGAPLTRSQIQMLSNGLSFRRMLFDVAKSTGEPLVSETDGKLSLSEENISRLTDALEVMRPNELP